MDSGCRRIRSSIAIIFKMCIGVAAFVLLALLMVSSDRLRWESGDGTGDGNKNEDDNDSECDAVDRRLTALLLWREIRRHRATRKNHSLRTTENFY